MDVLVLLDTNIVNTPDRFDLLGRDTRQIHKSVPSNVRIVWGLPDVVVRERHAQMVAEAMQSIGAHNLIAQLLGSQERVTKESLRNALWDRIKSELPSSEFQYLIVIIRW